MFPLVFLGNKIARFKLLVSQGEFIISSFADLPVVIEIADFRSVQFAFCKSVYRNKIYFHSIPCIFIGPEKREILIIMLKFMLDGNMQFIMSKNYVFLLLLEIHMIDL